MVADRPANRIEEDTYTAFIKPLLGISHLLAQAGRKHGIGTEIPSNI